ncbi:sensor histidine kinase [Priestia megaterium]|uniref:sensor histidine kinase n=1 Tax=Priestia megaterium TaxID=1404 RepID=UPI00285573BE|nr:HAMP domain-containing sensor histidine kinase [Priestia megaterium]MDR7246632.1 signal transduction histidine kinase [Priestia megaterium]
MSEQVKKRNLHEIQENNERETERRVAFLLWSSDKKLIKITPKKGLYTNDIDDFKPALSEGKTQTSQEVNGHAYRVMNVKNEGYIKDQDVSTIQLVLNVDPETQTLEHLAFLLIISAFIGLLLSLVAGLFLANRALVPIQKSWNKQVEFIADASHELRTPLSVMQTHLELLFRRPNHTIEQESENMYQSLNEVKRMTKLVGNLLTLARSDSSAQLLNKTVFNMDELVDKVANQFEPIFELKELRFIRGIESLMCGGDQERLHQLCMILLDNAFKYTPSGESIHISLKKHHHSMTLIVRDTGVGIEAKDLPYVFDRFYRSDKSRARAEGGSGLGLATAKWIVQAHDGEIKVFSQKNVGTEFYVKIPV